MNAVLTDERGERPSARQRLLDEGKMSERTETTKARLLEPAIYDVNFLGAAWRV